MYRQDGTPAYKARDQLSIADALARLHSELRRLGARNEILSSNVELRLDGLPRSDRRAPADPGVACYFTLDTQPLVLACDRWDRVADNIAAIALHIDAMRGMDRWGVGSLGQAFAGYAALPPAADWRVILGLNGAITPELIEARFRELARAAHPDAGGTGDLGALTRARDEALAAVTR